MKRTTVGLDLAKRVFQVHAVDPTTGEITRQTLKRSQVRKYFANRPEVLVAMEACGSSHYWGRELLKLGHEVRLIAAQFVRPFVKGNKTDAADAEAIWEAAQRPGMRFVALKSEEQQAVFEAHTTPEWSRRISAGWEGVYRQGIEVLREEAQAGRRTIVELIADDLQACRESASPLWDGLAYTVSAVHGLDPHDV